MGRYEYLGFLAKNKFALFHYKMYFYLMRMSRVDISSGKLTVELRTEE
jgi:hypothetical protein